MSPMTSSTFRPDRTHVLAVALMMGIALIGISWAPQYLGWILFIPILFIGWIYHAKTTVSEDGLDITYMFKKNAHIGWEDLDGISFKGMSAQATMKDGNEYTLPGVTFNSLPELAEASNGRITDVITEAAEAADGMVEVTDHEGNSVLMSQAEYDRHVAEQASKSTPKNPENPENKE